MKKQFHVFFVLLMIVTACTNTSSKPRSKIFRMNIRMEPPTMDPRKGGEIVSSSLHFILFEGLTQLNEDGSVSPAQAETIEISDDLITYTFHLKECYWSNGDRVTAQDFEKSWKDILSPEFPSRNAHLLYPIKNAEAAKRGDLSLDDVGITSLNEKTFVITLEKPTSYFLNLISFCVFFPVNSKVDTEHPDWMYNQSEHFVSNGPFKLKKWDHNSTIFVERNPHYWNAANIDLDGIELLMIPDEMTAYQMYEQGELDCIGAPLSTIPMDAIPNLIATNQLKTNSIPGTMLCSFNVNEFPFHNKNIRKAFGLSINRQMIIDNILQLNEFVGTSMIPPMIKTVQEPLFFRDHDIENARQHFKQGLAELNVSQSDLKNLTFTYPFNEINHRVAQTFQYQWREALGIDVQLEQVDFKLMYDRIAKREHQFALTNWYMQYTDPMNILELYKYSHNVKNTTAWENENYIKLINQSFYDKTEEQRNKTLTQAESFLLEEMPVAPVVHLKSCYLTKQHVKGYQFMPIGNLFYGKIRIAKEDEEQSSE